MKIKQDLLKKVVVALLCMNIFSQALAFNCDGKLPSDPFEQMKRKLSDYPGNWIRFTTLPRVVSVSHVGKYKADFIYATVIPGTLNQSIYELCGVRIGKFKYVYNQIMRRMIFMTKKPSDGFYINKLIIYKNKRGDLKNCNLKINGALNSEFFAVHVQNNSCTFS